MMMTRW